jgi:nitrite reductase (NADH) small subunit
MESEWTLVCPLEAIVPDTGVCALLGQEQVAVFRVGAQDVYAIGNVDPHSRAAVLSRGLVGSIGARIVVASPIYKQHFDLRSGDCVESAAHSVNCYRARVHDGQVWIAA